MYVSIARALPRSLNFSCRHNFVRHICLFAQLINNNRQKREHFNYQHKPILQRFPYFVVASVPWPVIPLYSIPCITFYRLLIRYSSIDIINNYHLLLRHSALLFLLLFSFVTIPMKQFLLNICRNRLVFLSLTRFNRFLFSPIFPNTTHSYVTVSVHVIFCILFQVQIS